MGRDAIGMESKDTTSPTSAAPTGAEGPPFSPADGTPETRAIPEEAAEEQTRLNAASAEVLYPEFSANDDGSQSTIIESLCMNCHEQGTTRILLTKIPFFKEVVLMAFDCPHCHYRSSGIQKGGTAIEDQGIEIRLRVQAKRDMLRSLVLSDAAVVSIPDLELEIPPSEGKPGRLTTVEGILEEVSEGLRYGQAERAVQNPETAIQVGEFLVRLEALYPGEIPFSLRVRDITGNSHLESLTPGRTEPNVEVEKFFRSEEEDLSLGIQPPAATEYNQAGPPPTLNTDHERHGEVVDPDLRDVDDGGDGQTPDEEVMIIHENCPSCHHVGENRMKLTDIPYFKQVLIISFACDFCGYKSSEIKPSAAIENQGRKTTLRVESIEDLSRDLLKSHTASLMIPEVELELAPGTLGGMFTTIEGMIHSVHTSLRDSNPFLLGDSSDSGQRRKFLEFLDRLEGLQEANIPFHVVIDDPAGNSYIQNLYAPDPDPQMTVELYERTKDQNDELGILPTASEEKKAIDEQGEA